MSGLPKIEIKCPNINRAEIWIDGHKLPGVREITVFLPLDEVPYVKVEFVSTDISFDGVGALEVTAVDAIAEDSYLDRITHHVAEKIRQSITNLQILRGL